MNITDKNGPVIELKTVSEIEDIMLVSKEGIVIRVPASSISVIGRNTQGVRIMKLEPEDKVVSVAKVAKEEECNISSPQPEEQKQ